MSRSHNFEHARLSDSNSCFVGMTAGDQFIISFKISFRAALNPARVNLLAALGIKRFLAESQPTS